MVIISKDRYICHNTYTMEENMEYRILVDSCTDLPKQLKEDTHFKVIPLSLMVDDKVFVDNDGFSFS